MTTRDDSDVWDLMPSARDGDDPGFATAYLLGHLVVAVRDLVDRLEPEVLIVEPGP